MYKVPISKVLAFEKRYGQIPYLLDTSIAYLEENGNQTCSTFFLICISLCFLDRIKTKGIFRVSGDGMEMEALYEMFEERLKNRVSLVGMSNHAVAANMKL